MSRLELPDGDWAELCAAKKVPERKRNRHQSAIFAFHAATADLPRDVKDPEMPDSRYVGADHSELMKAIERAMILCFVREWSFGEVSGDALQDLPCDAYDVLVARCTELLPEMRPDFSPDPDPKARTSEPSQLPSSLSTAETYATRPFAATS